MAFDPANLPSGESASLGTTTIDLRAAYPPGVAVLDVLPLVGDEGQRFGLRGYCCCDELLWTAPDRHRRPGRIDVAALITRDGGESPAHTFLRLKNWSSSKIELQRWLSCLRERHGDALTLIVRDCTDFGIAWELFWLSGPDGGDWLGSAITVTRWVTMPRARSTVSRLPLHRARAGGEVVAYVADGPMRADLEVLKELDAVITETFWDLLARMDEPGGPFALVYAACHGRFSGSSLEFLLDDAVSVADVDTARLSRLARFGGLVFLNACHSARLIDDPEYNDATQRGFAEAFLRAGATGFIGTVGVVAEEQAHRYLREIIRLLRERPGTPIAVTIRDLRRRHSVRIPPRSNDPAAARALLPFFHTFMYAYYGGPSDYATLPPLREGRR